MATAGQMDEAGRLPRLRLRLPDRLPHLGGRRAALVRSVYLAVALAVLVVIAGSFWFNGRDYFGNMTTAARYGIRTNTSDGGVGVAGAGSAEARRSGLKPGDRILAIDGERLAGDATEYSVAERLGGDRDGRVVLRTRSADGAVRDHRLTRSPLDLTLPEPATQLPLWLFISIGFGAAQLPLLLFFAASLLLARRRPRDPEAMMFAFGFLLMSVNSASGFWIIALFDVPNQMFERISNFGACLIVAAIAGFPDGRYSSLWSRVTLLMVAVLAFLIVTRVAFTEAITVLFLLVNIGVLGSVWLRYRREALGVERQQIKWAVLGFGAALSLILPVQLLITLGALEHSERLEFLLDRLVISLALLLIPAGLLVSLLRYRLYDAEAAISRSAAYAVMTLLLGAAFAAGAEGIEWLFETNLGRDAGALPGAMGAALAALLFTPLNNRVQGWAERRFQKELIHLRRDLPDCVADLRETSGLQGLLEDVLERLGAGVRAGRVAAIVRGGLTAVRGSSRNEAEAWLSGTTLDAAEGELACDRSDLLFPMRVPLQVRHGGGEPICWILLGPRPDGSFYGKDEQEALAEVADPIARAVQVVLLREERETRQEARFAALERRLAEAIGRRESPAAS